MRRSRARWLPLVVVGLCAAPLAAQPSPVWPAPPEEPRIRFLSQLQSEADFGRKESFFGRLKRSLSGGAKPGHLRVQRPYDVYTQGGERIYVTDGMTPGVILFDAKAKSARLLGADAPGGISRPLGLGGDGTGRVYVADPGAGRIVVLDAAGAYLRTFGGRGLLFNPVDVAVDSAGGRYYVVDSYLHQVLVFDSAGTLQGRIGRMMSAQMNPPSLTASTHQPGGPARENATPGDTALTRDHAGAGIRSAQTRDLWLNRGGAKGEFRYPSAIAVAADGTLFVVDQMNFRIQVFDRSGGFVREIGRLGDVPGSFARPKGVAVDSEGHLYVSDAAFNNIQVFNRDGTLLLAFGGLGHGDGQHWMPLGLSIDNRDRIYVADRYNNRAAVYQYLAAPVTQAGQTMVQPAAAAGVRRP